MAGFQTKQLITPSSVHAKSNLPHHRCWSERISVSPAWWLMGNRPSTSEKSPPSAAGDWRFAPPGGANTPCARPTAEPAEET